VVCFILLRRGDRDFFSAPDTGGNTRFWEFVALTRPLQVSSPSAVEEISMSNAEDVLARQRKKAAAYSLASDLLANGDSPAHVEDRLVKEGLLTEESHEIVSALHMASQRAENVMRGRDEDGRPREYPDNFDRLRPPTLATLVKCERCGYEYESNRIEEQREGEEGRPPWCCPTPGCTGGGFGFNIFPVNRQFHNEEGDWAPLITFYPDAARRHQLHYTFAHRFLPQYVHDDPDRFFRPICQEAPTLFIHMAWGMFLHRAGLIRGHRLRRVSDLTMDLRQLAGHLAALIEMPTPEAPLEAFFVGVVLLADAAAPSPASTSARVFTLEAEHKEVAVAGEAIAGEWARDGRHLNYGRIPCNREAFLQWINDQLIRKKPPWWRIW
jgi:hypothetical protein